MPSVQEATPFKQLVEGDTRSEPLGTGEGGWAAGQNFAYACNLVEEEEEAAGPSGGDGGGPSDPNARGAAARWEAEQVAATEGEDVEVEVLSQPPPPKKPKKGGDGGSSSQALELTETQE